MIERLIPKGKHSEYDYLILDSPTELLDILTSKDFCKSRSEGKRLLEQNGVTLQGRKVSGPCTILPGLVSLNLMKSRRKSLIIFPSFPEDSRWEEVIDGEFIIDQIIDLINIQSQIQTKLEEKYSVI